MKKVWFITGSSRGFGRALTEAVLAAGHSVVATARRPEQLNDLVARYGTQVRAVALDVTDAVEAEKAMATAVSAFGRIDVLVNNAGGGMMGAVEEVTTDLLRAQMDINFWGVVNVTRAALPILRRQGHGHIVQITSIAGRLAVPGMSGYHASKFAAEGFSESLAQEIKPLGLKLTMVEPGGFRTDFAGSSMSHGKPMKEYLPTVGVLRDYLAAHAGQEPGDPRKGAAAILQLVEQPAPPLRLPLGSDAVAFLRHSYQQNLDELNRGAVLSSSTDFDGLKVSSTGHELLAAV